MPSRLSTSTVLLVAALVPIACSSSQEKARARLGAMNIPYSDESLVDRAGAGDAIVVRDFLQSGMKPDVMNKEGKTPLIAAAEAGRLDVARILLDAGAKVDATDRSKTRKTALLAASGAGRTDIVKLLLSKGANKRVRDLKAGMSPLHAATLTGSPATARLLLESGEPVNEADKEGRTALMFASVSGRTDLMQLLLEHGADLKLKDTTHGADALTVAAANGRTSAALLLLNKGANPRSADATGKTPVMWAAKNGHADTLKLILDHGGELAAKDGDGKTAAVLAKESKQSAVEAFIKSTAAGS